MRCEQCGANLLMSLCFVMPVVIDSTKKLIIKRTLVSK